MAENRSIHPESRYVRPFNEAEAADTPIPNYYAQVISDHQTGLFMAIYIPEGSCGPGLHYHHCDQLYYLTQGSVTIILRDETYDVEAGSLIYIPAGVPHYNWNNGKGTEAHLEMQFPSPNRFRLMGYQVEKPEDVPDEWKTDGKAYVVKVKEESSKAIETAPGLKMMPLADRSNGSKNVQLYYEEIAPHKGGSTTHIHEFDKYFFVLDGELSMEIALQRHVAKEETLVVVPAGVPYRQHSAGEAAVKYLVFLVPPPNPDAVLDIGVSFAATGENQTGKLLEVESFNKQ